MSKNISTQKTEVTTKSNETTQKAKTFNCPENYAPSSSIYKAYSNGFFPVAHKILFNAICKALNEKTEGKVNFNAVLEDAKMHRSSALNIIKHMVAWNILEVSFNSSQAIGEKRKYWAFVKIIRNPEVQELPKSA